MEMDYTRYNNIIKIKTFDIVVNPGFGATTISNNFNIFPLKKVLRKRKIENLLDFFDKTNK